jgi:phosphomannomutase
VEDIISAAREVFASRPGVRLDESDGLRIDFDDAWVSVRASNTEPIIRIMAEAPDTSAVEALVAEVTEIAGTATGS